MKTEDTTHKITKCYDADAHQTRGTRIASEVVFLIFVVTIALTTLTISGLLILKLL